MTTKMVLYEYYIREVNQDGNVKYRKHIWFNESAKNKVVQYAQQLQSN